MSPNSYASLVVLSYHRLDYLKRTLQSLRRTTPRCELIVVDDGSRDETWTYLFQKLRDGQISTLIVNGGPNRGVGEGIRRGWAVAGGDYLVKLDADLEFKPGWLEAGMWALDTHSDVGCVGWFDYHHYSPDDPRFNVLEDRDFQIHEVGGVTYNVKIVDDFVSSAMIIRTTDYAQYGPIDTGSAAFAEDVMFKQKLQANGLKLAILSPDMVVNLGFGLGKSTVVTANAKGEGVVTMVHPEPYLVGG